MDVVLFCSCRDKLVIVSVLLFPNNDTDANSTAVVLVAVVGR